MERETTFRLGGASIIALCGVFAVALVWAGAGIEYASAYLGLVFGAVLGAFFYYVGGAEAKERRAYLERASDASIDDPGRPP